MAITTTISITQRDPLVALSAARLVVRDQQALAVLQALGGDEHGVPGLHLFQVAGDVRVEDNHHAVGVLH